MNGFYVTLYLKYFNELRFVWAGSFYLHIPLGNLLRRLCIVLCILIYPLARGISPIKDNSRLRMPTALAFTFVPRLSRLPSCDRPIILSAVTFIQGRARTPGRADHERELDARVSACLYPRIRRKQDIGERIEVKRWPPRLFL